MTDTQGIIALCWLHLFRYLFLPDLISGFQKMSGHAAESVFKSENLKSSIIPEFWNC